MRPSPGGHRGRRARDRALPARDRRAPVLRDAGVPREGPALPAHPRAGRPPRPGLRLGREGLLLRAEPEKFFTTPHYDGHPSVLVHLAAVDREELAEVLADAWRARAPKRLADALDP